MSGQPPPAPEPGKPGGDPHTFSQEVHHPSVAARVPEKVSRGVFSNGILVLQWHTEFVLDFILRLSQPHQVAARVAVPISLMPRLINTLRENLDNYRKAFGPPPALPLPPPPAKPPSIEEIYDTLKIPDDVLSGVYANAALVSHSPAEFCFDFITNFYPKSAVSARVFLSAAQVPVMLNNLVQAWQNYQVKLQQQQQREPPKPPPPAP
jgi:hypothetical protein